MDGKTDAESQTRLVRAVLGRKFMELDEFIDRSSGCTDGESAAYDGLIEFLKNDIKGYKAVLNDIKTGEYSGGYYDITSLPETSVGIYNDFYLPRLGGEDLPDEEAAMALKSEFAASLVDNRYIKTGRKALENPLVLGLMAQNKDILAVVGKIVLSEPELINALND